MANVYPFALPLQEESIRVNQLEAGHYADALKKDVTKKFFDELKNRAITKQHLTMSSFGTTGSGKSYQMMFIAEILAKHLGIELTIDNVAFTITDMLKLVENARKGDILILDEQIGSAGTGSRVEKILLNNIEMTTRQHKLNFFFLSPEHIAHNYHYFVETWRPAGTSPYNPKLSMEEQWVYTQGIIFDHRQKALGYIVTGKPTNKEFLEKYEKKKSEFITGVRGRTGSKRSDFLRDKAKKLFQDEKFFVDFVTAKNKTIRGVILDIALSGEMMSVQERNNLISYMQYILATDPAFIEMVKVLKPSPPKKKVVTRKKKKKKPIVFYDEDASPGDFDRG